MSRKSSSSERRRTIAAIAGLAWLACVGNPSPARAELLTGLTTTNSLVTFDSAAPGTILGTVPVTGLQVNEALLGIDRRPETGQLYGLGDSNQLYVINPITGAATQVGAPLAFFLNGQAFGFDFNPVADRIRVTSTADQNMRLNPSTGALAATDTALAYAAGDPNAGSDPFVVGSAYTNNFAGTLTTTLYDIDIALGILVTQNPPNAGLLNTVGSLGFTTSDLVGFDISGASGAAFASLTAPAANSSNLFTINLATGAATLVGTIGGGVPLNGLAAASAVVPEPGAVSLLALGLLGLLAYIGGGRRVRKGATTRC